MLSVTKRPSFSHQDASLDPVHGRVGEDLLLQNAHRKLAKDADWSGLHFGLEENENCFKNKTSIIALYI